MRRLLILISTIAITATAGSAFTATNTVRKTKAGAGVSSVSSYTVSNINYSLNHSTPQAIDAVAFTLSGTPAASSTIRVRLTSTGTTWYPCTFSGTRVTCTTTTPSAQAPTSDQLQVVIAD